VGQVERVTYSGTFQRQGDVLVVDRLQGPEFGLRADGIVIFPREDEDGILIGAQRHTDLARR
jgi:hypothetical protein